MTRKDDRRPRRHQGGDQMHSDGGISPRLQGSPVIPRQLTVCWRCGRPIAWTTLDDLRRCTELARAS